jgi:hypothetical protein
MTPRSGLTSEKSRPQQMKEKEKKNVLLHD